MSVFAWTAAIWIVTLLTIGVAYFGFAFIIRLLPEGRLRTAGKIVLAILGLIIAVVLSRQG